MIFLDFHEEKHNTDLNNLTIQKWVKNILKSVIQAKEVTLCKVITSENARKLVSEVLGFKNNLTAFYDSYFVTLGFFFVCGKLLYLFFL